MTVTQIRAYIAARRAALVDAGYSIHDWNAFATGADESLDLAETRETELLAAIAPPTTVDDTGASATTVAVTVDVLANDTAGGGDIVPTSVKIVDGTSRVTELTVESKGVWSVSATDGKITFTPDAALTGSPAAIEYVVYDEFGLESEPASVTITYGG
jgi:hypothetical protein